MENWTKNDEKASKAKHLTEKCSINEKLTKKAGNIALLCYNDSRQSEVSKWRLA